MSSGKEIRISITSALNAAGIEATKRQVDQMSKSVGGSLSELANANKTHWADIKAAWDMAAGAITKITGFIQDAIRKAFDAEYALTNFKTLLGSVDAAKEHVAELKKFASQTPLTFGDLSQASKTLLAFGVSVENVVPSLRVLGDISLGNAEKFQSLALAFGKVESQGKLTGIELKQMVLAGFNPLQEIVRKTGADMGELKDQMEAGEISFELVEAAMRSATGEGGRFNNALKDASTTGNGLMSTLQDNWNMAIASFGNAFVDARKEGLQKLIEKLQELNQSGTIDTWAGKVSKALEVVISKFMEAVEACSAIGKALNWLYEKSGASDIVHGLNSIVQGTANGIGSAIGGGSFLDAYNEASMEEIVKGFYGNLAAKSGMLGESFENVAKVNEELKEQEKELQAKIAERAEAEKTAAEAVTTTTQENRKSLEEIYAARKQLADAEKEEAEREKEKAEGDKLWADVWKEELADATKAEAEARRKAAEATNEVKSAEEKLKEVIKKYNDNIAKNLTNEVVVGAAADAVLSHGLQNGHNEYLKNVKAIGKAAGQVAADNALASGQARTVAQYDRIYKDAEREARVNSNRQAAEEGRDAQRAARLSQMSSKAMSKADKDWLEKWNKVNEANRKQKEDIQKAQKEAADAKKRKEDAEKAMVDSAKDIAEIKRKLNALGLK